MKRYVVRPCDDGASIEGQPRSRSWDVVDALEDRTVSNHLTRGEARAEARYLNDSITTRISSCPT